MKQASLMVPIFINYPSNVKSKTLPTHTTGNNHETTRYSEV